MHESVIALGYQENWLQILASAFNDGADQLMPMFVAQFQPSFPTGSCTRDSVSAYLRNPPGKRTYVPIFLFIDPKQVIREQHSGEEPFFQNEDRNIRAVLDNLLKEPVEAKKTAGPAKKAAKKTS